MVTFDNSAACSGTSETLIREAATHAAMPAKRNKMSFLTGAIGFMIVSSRPSEVQSQPH